MGDRKLARRLRSEFVDKVDFTLTEKVRDVEDRYKDDVFGWFLYGLKMCDGDITRSVLDIVSEYEKSVYSIGKRGKDWRNTVVSFTEFAHRLDKALSGDIGKADRFDYVFNPFYGTPEDMYDIYREISRLDSTIQPMKDLFNSVADFMERMYYINHEEGNEYLWEEVKSFFLSWLTSFWTLLEEHREEMVSAEYEEGKSLHSEIMHFIRYVSYERTYDKAFDSLFSFLLETEKECSKEEEGKTFAEILDHAFDCENSHIFRTVLEEADRRGYSFTFDEYPSYSVDILDMILSRGELLPGTEKGRKAFLRLIRSGRLSDEILTRIIHPDYITPSLLSEAVSNCLISPSQYHYFVSQEGGLDEAFREACRRGNQSAAEKVISLGADPTAKNKRGRNIAHELISTSERRPSFESIMRLLPSECFREKDSNGMTHVDCYFS